MANNTRIGLTNLIATATLKNGTGGGAPALDQSTGYPTSNLKTSDRYTLWKTGDPPSGSPVQVDFDLGSNKTVTSVGVLGYRGPFGTAVTSVAIYSAASASGYPPGAWTLQATINVNALFDTRDFGAIIASVSHRYWRFEFTHGGTAWSIGKLWVGNATDLGAIHSPGGLYAPFRNRLETPLPNGAVVLSDLGDPGADWTLPWQTITSSLRTTLLSLQQQTGSFLMIDPDDNFFEVYLVGGRAETLRQFTTTFDANLALRRLP
jgi:hypothetical protein